MGKIFTESCLDKIYEEPPEEKVEVSNNQLLACGMVKTVLSMKLKKINRQFLKLLKELEENKEELV